MKDVIRYMNERDMPEFTADELKRRLVRIETLTGKTIDQHPACLDLIASVMIALAVECNLIPYQQH